MSIDISVVICTYNRANLLPGVLESLCLQTLATNRFEILVVNNASTDHTPDVVRAYQDKYTSHPVRILYEARQGLGYARNIALKEAVGAYIAYLDDDARADTKWLELAIKRIEVSMRPHCFGGPIKPFYTTEKPSWFKDQYETRTWGELERRLLPGESLSGSNMIWRKDTIQSIGGFGETVGITGKYLSVGEETIAFQRLWQQEHNVVVIYDPALVVFHWVPVFKMKVPYYLKRSFIIGQVANRFENPQTRFGRLRSGLRSCAGAIVRTARAFWRFHHYQHWQNWAIEECLSVASKLGSCCAAFGIFFNIEQK